MNSENPFELARVSALNAAARKNDPQSTPSRAALCANLDRSNNDTDFFANASTPFVEQIFSVAERSKSDVFESACKRDENQCPNKQPELLLQTPAMTRHHSEPQ